MTPFGDNPRGQESDNNKSGHEMSEYYLADALANERARQRERQTQQEQPPKQAQDVKFTLLCDFPFASGEPEGCDPYNATNGKSARDVWRLRRDRR